MQIPPSPSNYDSPTLKHQPAVSSSNLPPLQPIPPSIPDTRVRNLVLALLCLIVFSITYITAQMTDSPSESPQKVEIAAGVSSASTADIEPEKPPAVNQPPEIISPSSAGGSQNVYGLDPEEAEVVLQEAYSLGCPSCAAHHPTLKTIREEYKDRITFQVIHYPLTTSFPNARAGHRAVEAAAQQGPENFWALHDKLFEERDAWVESSDPIPQIKIFAEELGLDMKKFDEDFASILVNDIINQDEAYLKDLDVRSTPTFLINGEVLEGDDDQAFGHETTARQFLDALLGQEVIEEPVIELPSEPPSIDHQYPNTPDQIKTLAHSLGLTDQAKVIFYDHDPQIFASVDDFGFECVDRLQAPDNVTIYGCWISTQKIQMIDNLSLETTAAHELLHAVYNNLSRAERRVIKGYIDQVVANNYWRIQDILAAYDYSNLSIEAQYDELHAFIGTEFYDIPAGLEEHYQDYFIDRSQVVDFYQRVYDSRTQKQQALFDFWAPYEQQRDYYYNCLIDRIGYSHECPVYLPNQAAFEEFQNCLYDETTLWDDCILLQPVLTPYFPYPRESEDIDDY